MNDRAPPRPIPASLVLLGCASVLAVHLAVLYTSGADPFATPVGALSRGEDGNLHGLGLSLLALALAALAALVHRPGAGWPTRAGQLSLVVDAALVVYLAYRFASPDADAAVGTGADAPLWLIACVTGLAMGLLVPGLLATNRAAGRWTLVCLVLWLALVPPGLFVEPHWRGAYERLVGLTMVGWMAGLAVLVGFTPTEDRGGADR